MERFCAPPIFSMRTDRLHPIRLKIETAPASEPITTAEAKSHLRVDSSDDDTIIGNLITVAREVAEKYTNRAFIDQTWHLFLDEWPSKGGRNMRDFSDAVQQGVRNVEAVRFIYLPKNPIQTIDEVLTFDDEDNSTVFAATNYFLDDATDPARFIIRDDGEIPLPTRTANGIRIEFTAGYGSSSSDVPQALIQGMLTHIAAMYENRGDKSVTDTKVFQTLPALSQTLYDPYRIITLL